jgi:phosphatidylserine/phosphatidylglycerophosphate/cardiolipin synthase-like enzyme
MKHNIKYKLLFLLIVYFAILSACIAIPSPTQVIQNKQQELDKGATYVTKTWSDIGSQLNNSENATYTTYVGNSCYFTQEGNKPEIQLINLYKNSKSTLDIAIYGLTQPGIVKEIGDAYKRGVVVRLVSDKVESHGATQKHAINDLLAIGIPVKINHHSGLMHIKMSIIDKKITTLGSYNYTTNASTENDEILYITDDAHIMARCLTEFNRIWADQKDYDTVTEYIQ